MNKKSKNQTKTLDVSNKMFFSVLFVCATVITGLIVFAIGQFHPPEEITPQGAGSGLSADGAEHADVADYANYAGDAEYAVSADNAAYANDSDMVDALHASDLLAQDGGGGITVLTLHSGTTTAPSCPTGWTQVMTGYSLVGLWDSTERIISSFGSLQCVGNAPTYLFPTGTIGRALYLSTTYQSGGNTRCVICVK